MQFVLAQSSLALIAIRHVLAYPSGFEFTVDCLVRQLPDDPEVLMGFQGLPYYMRRSPDPARLPDGLFRFGIKFADGSKVTTLQDPHVRAMVSDPDRPVLLPMGSGSSGSPRRLGTNFWCFPLPPPPRMHFVCEWPALGTPFTTHEVEVNPIQAAASQAVQLWS